jgi:hypothetical protein
MSINLIYGDPANYQPLRQPTPVGHSAAPAMASQALSVAGHQSFADVQHLLETQRQNELQQRADNERQADSVAAPGVALGETWSAAERMREKAAVLAGEKDLAVNYIHKLVRWGSDMRDENMRASYDKKLQALADAKCMSVDEVEGYLREIFPLADGARFRALAQDGIGQAMEVRSNPPALATALEAGNMPSAQDGNPSAAYQPDFQPPLHSASQLDLSLRDPQAEANHQVLNGNEIWIDLLSRIDNQRRDEYTALVATFGPQAQQSQEVQRPVNGYPSDLPTNLNGSKAG